MQAIRQNIIDLIKYDKPLLIHGKYVLSKTVDSSLYCTFLEIYPFAWRCTTRVLSDHITIDRKTVERYTGRLDITHDGKEFILVVRPYVYYGNNGMQRGGLRLTDELDCIRPILPRNQLRQPWQKVPINQIIDLRYVDNPQDYLYENHSDGTTPKTQKHWCGRTNFHEAMRQKQKHDCRDEKRRATRKEAARQRKLNKKKNKGKHMQVTT